MILFCFFLSGAAALIYEVVWFRYLTLLFGISSHALSTILIAYMVGLGLGSYVIAKRKWPIPSPWAFYAVVEVVIGIYALLSKYFFLGIKPFYVYAYQVEDASFQGQSLFWFLSSLGVLILPTFLMGTTFPVLVHAMTRTGKKVCLHIGNLYFVNALGGAFGALLTGYVSILFLGMTASLWLGFGFNLLAAGGALWVHRKDEADASLCKPVETKERFQQRGSLLVTMVLFLSGLAAMIYQVVWNRLISLFVGSSTYAFTTVVVMVLVGIALGGMLMGRWAQRTRHPLSLLLATEIILAVFVGWTTPFLDQSHFFIFKVFMELGSHFWVCQLAEWLIALGIIFVPSLLLGSVLPLGARLDGTSDVRSDQLSGRLYAANTFGAILGVALAGFWMLSHPHIGTQKTLLIGGMINGISACLLLSLTWHSKPYFSLAVGALLLGTGWGVWKYSPSWSPAVIASGVWDRPDYLREELRRRNIEALVQNRPLETAREALKFEMERERLLFSAEGADATVTVTHLPHPEPPILKFLRINGKCDATSYHDLPSQVLVAQIAMCLHPHPQRVLVMGLGSGITWGSVLSHPEVQQADCVELAPSVVKAASFFNDENRSVLANPRGRLILNDGRNHVMATSSQYDVIVSEPSNPWMAGVANLFTLEHYQNCRKRLRPWGLMGQWFHLYGNSPEMVRMLVRTFQEVFPYSTLWHYQTDAFLVGSADEWKPDLEVIQHHFLEKGVAMEMARAEMKSPSKLMDAFLLRGDHLRKYTGAGPFHTDEHPRLEYLLPRVRYDRTHQEILQEIRSFMPRP